MKKIAMLILMSIAIVSCTEQSRARQFGGKLEIKVEAGYKVTSATWKDGNNLFYFIEPMEDGYVPKTKKFIESASFGILESEVIFTEQK